MREVRICSRCFGFFCGEVLALGAFLLLKPQINAVFYGAVCISLVLAYSDWMLTRNGWTKSNNLNRFISGLFLGLGGAALIYMVLSDYVNIVPYVIGSVFITIALLVKRVSESRIEITEMNI